MRISDWSSDVCASDLLLLERQQRRVARHPLADDAHLSQQAQELGGRAYRPVGVGKDRGAHLGRDGIQVGDVAVESAPQWRAGSSEERRVGKEGGSTGRSWCAPVYSKKKQRTQL